MKAASVLLFLLISASDFQSIFAMVQTTSGPITGMKEVLDGKTLDVYLGIPYATPPIGNLRFRKTVPVQRWTTPLKADAYPPACIQYYPVKYPWVDWGAGQSEDCLYLNIWSPSNNGDPKAVLFWIHSGGFSTGSSRQDVYKGHVISARGNVIVVTVNYRLGVFGFLSTPSEEAPGNMGLYDILEALKWVSNNIEAFGGDPNRITLWGQSAGSLAIGVFCASPLTTGLFQRVIMESGAPARLIDERSYIKNLHLAGQLSVAVDCAINNNSVVEDSSSVVQCLRKKDAVHLAVMTNSFNPGSLITFNFIHGDQFLPENPRTAVQNLQLQDIDVLAGGVRDEGSFHLTAQMPDIFGPFGEKNTNINKSFGESIVRRVFDGMPFKEAVLERYLGENDSWDVRRQVYHLEGDFSLFCPTLFFAESYARKGRVVYFYYFDHRPHVSPWAPWMGVVHFAEVPFLFGRPLERTSRYSEAEKQRSLEMISLWTDFAKYGNPGSKWPAFSREKPNILTFGLSEDKESQLSFHLENCNFFRPYFGFP